MLGSAIQIAAIRRQLSQPQPCQGRVGGLWPRLAQRLTALAGLLGIGALHGLDEGIVQLRSLFRLFSAVAVPVLPAKQGNHAQHNAGDDAVAVFTPPAFKVLDAFVVGVLFHAIGPLRISI